VPARLSRRLLPFVAIVALAACARPASAVFTPDTKDLQELNAASFDPDQAESVIARSRGFLTKDLDPSFQGFFRQIILRAMTVSGAPVQEIVAAADSVKPFIGTDPSAVVRFNMAMTATMLNREDGLPQAETYARQAVDACPSTPDWAFPRANALTLLGAVEVERGKHTQAIEHLTRALPDAGDSAAVLRTLGRAYRGTKQTDKAIDAYLRGLGTFPCDDTTGMAELSALYVGKRHTAAELEKTLKARCDASREEVALRSRRHVMPAPDWTLQD